MSDWVSIDFGTCNSAAAIAVDGRPKLVSPNNVPFFPTVACVLGKDRIVVCQQAEGFKSRYPDLYLQEFKLNIGDAIDCNGADYRRVVAEILRYIKGCAENENNGERIGKALLTVPAIYTEQDRRKEVMRQAARDAGFTTVEFLREPQAAAYHYAYVSGNRRAGLSLIYDLGGGTFDPALMDMSDASSPVFLGCSGGVKCGGQYFDAAIYKRAQQEAKAAGKPLGREKRWEDYGACKRLKEGLSAMPQGTALLSNDEVFTLDRAGLRELIEEKLELTLEACDMVVRTARKEWRDVGQVLLVGGSTSIPLVSEMLQRHLASHNAAGVRVVRSLSGEKGEYSHNYAVCLGGIAYAEGLLDAEADAEDDYEASDFWEPKEEPREEVSGRLECGGRTCRLKEGTNTFGRSESQDFTFGDPTMSREHFAVEVSRNGAGRYEYVVTTRSGKKATVVGMLALDLRYAYAPKVAVLKDGDTITAGNTRFTFRK